MRWSVIQEAFALPRTRQACGNRWIPSFETDGDRVCIVVNGRPLLDAVRDAELACGTHPDVAGVYLPLRTDALTTLEPESHPFNRATWILLYVCKCGFACCSGLWVRCQRTAALVKWTGFVSEPRHVPCSYSGVGPFRFDRQQYDDALYATWNHLLQHGTVQRSWR